MPYDYSKKRGRRYRRGDHERLILSLLVVAVGITFTCIYFALR